jgi:ArsR family transcriptional regulator
MTRVTPRDIDVEEDARLFAMLGDPTRLRIAQLLLDGEKYVSELAELTGASPTGISQQLRFLREGGFVARRKAGNRAFYKMNSDRLADFLKAAPGFSRLPPSAADR